MSNLSEWKADFKGYIDTFLDLPRDYYKVIMAYINEVPSAQPQDIAQDIARIIENEKDMRVIAKNAQTDIILCKDCKQFRDHRCMKANHHVSGWGNCMEVFGAERQEE